MTLEEVRALEAHGSNLGGRGGHLTAGRGFEWGAPRPNLGPGVGERGDLGVSGRLRGWGTGGLLRGRRSSKPQETGCPRSGERDHPQGPRAGAGL